MIVYRNVTRRSDPDNGNPHENIVHEIALIPDGFGADIKIEVRGEAYNNGDNDDPRIYVKISAENQYNLDSKSFNTHDLRVSGAEHLSLADAYRTAADMVERIINDLDTLNKYEGIE